MLRRVVHAINAADRLIVAASVIEPEPLRPFPGSNRIAERQS